MSATLPSSLDTSAKILLKGMLHWACTVGLCGVWCVGWVGGFFALVAVFFASFALRLPIYQMLRYFNVSCDMSFSWM